MVVISSKLTIKVDTLKLRQQIVKRSIIIMMIQTRRSTQTHCVIVTT